MSLRITRQSLGKLKSVLYRWLCRWAVLWKIGIINTVYCNWSRRNNEEISKEVSQNRENAFYEIKMPPRNLFSNLVIIQWISKTDNCLHSNKFEHYIPHSYILCVIFCSWSNNFIKIHSANVCRVRKVKSGLLHKNSKTMHSNL